jgi:hypothetical protein
VSVLTGALGMGRAFAESVMTETVTIGTEAEGDTLDPSTGQYLLEMAAVYEGRARYKAGGTAASQIDAVSQLLTEQDAQLSLPIETSLAVAKGMTVVVTASESDPGLVGLRVRIKAPSVGSYRTARRFAVEQTT